jgi:hypothetical protein
MNRPRFEHLDQCESDWAVIRARYPKAPIAMRAREGDVARRNAENRFGGVANEESRSRELDDWKHREVVQPGQADRVCGITHCPPQRMKLIESSRRADRNYSTGSRLWRAPLAGHSMD